MTFVVNLGILSTLVYKITREVKVGRSTELQPKERSSFCYDDDDDDDEEYTIAITPVLPTEKPDIILQMSSQDRLIVNREHEEYISLLERLLYDNSSPRPSEDFHAIPNTIIESFPTFSIPVEDSDSLREEIDIFPSSDDSIPPGIKSDDYDSESDDNSTSLPEFESFHVDYPDSGDSTIDVVEDIPVDVPNILGPPPPPYMDFELHSSIIDLGSDLDVSSPFGDRNKIYDLGICIEVEPRDFLYSIPSEKSAPSSSHRGFKASKLLYHKSPMLIHGENIPILDVPFLHFYPP
ncbi:hypothetical protein Tco_0226199 [Tanacetum coccineum]